MTDEELQREKEAKSEAKGLLMDLIIWILKTIIGILIFFLLVAAIARCFGFMMSAIQVFGVFLAYIFLDVYVFSKFRKKD